MDKTAEGARIYDDLVTENAQLKAELAEFTELKEYAKSLGQETYLELHARNERLRGALESIANNTCCEGCQEAAKWARSALSSH